MSGQQGSADMVQLRCSGSWKEGDGGEKGIRGEGKEGKRRGGTDQGEGEEKEVGKEKQQQQRCMLIDVWHLPGPKPPLTYPPWGSEEDARPWKGRPSTPVESSLEKVKVKCRRKRECEREPETEGKRQ